MNTYIALLRGINVSGKNLIKMDELKSMLCSLNLINVRTYIQSGNIIFESDTCIPLKLENEIEEKILQHFGLQIPVIIKSKIHLIEILKNTPFEIQKNEDISKLYITFLKEKPDMQNQKKLEEQNNSPDKFIISDKEIYLYCPNGYGKTKLTNNFFEKKLKTTATTRNYKTIETLSCLKIN